ncbi:hypothetical protein GGR54DRAFT_269603 [Hypoxylon sp. NC1633]|nr:hypothetical protein GGR54DRAFT_269603 [Hypoxylon sp. NC1633]
MALTVKHLNSDASFLLSFEPIIPDFAQGTVIPQPFTILLDPWITGPSKIFHPKISISTHIHPACIASLSELPSPPDLVVVSQHKSDHCNEATLRQLPARGTKTLILAEPAAARVIRSWKYFDQDKIRTIERWEDPRVTGKQTVIRVPVPPVAPGGQAGEVTVAFIPQKRDLAGLHAAIGITYRPPPTHNLRAVSKPPTPPATPSTHASTESTAISTNTLPVPESFLLPPTPPTSPHSLRSVQSASTLIAKPQRPSFRGHTHTHPLPHTPSPSHPQPQPPLPRSPSLLRPSTSNGTTPTPTPTLTPTRPLSVLFSPHGIAYTHLSDYATSHLVAEAALPLTALLHCMDAVWNPWWLGGNVSAGSPAGAQIASRLGARVWLSAHDGEKRVRGLATGLLRTRRWGREEVEGALGSGAGVGNRDGDRGIGDGDAKVGLGHARTGSGGSRGSAGGVSTEVMRLGSGDEVIVSELGVLWCSAENGHDGWRVSDAMVRSKCNGNGNGKVQGIPKLAEPRKEKIPGGLKTRKSSKGGLSVRFKSTTSIAAA